MSQTITILDIPEKDTAKVVYLKGEIDDTNLPELEKALTPLFDEEAITVIIFHLKDLQYINSRVIQYFASSYSRLHSDGKKLILAEGNEHITDILDLVGFTSLVEYFPSLREAIKSLDI